MLPHMEAAYRLARRLTGRQQDAEDVVQDAYLRAFRFFGGFRGGDSRVWLLTIVRNVCYDWIRQNRMNDHRSTEFEEDVHSPAADDPDAETGIIEKIDSEEVSRALQRLPVDQREIIVLRELEGFSYKEISTTIGVPIGTVMSRLARARRQLKTEILRGRSR